MLPLKGQPGHAAFYVCVEVVQIDNYENDVLAKNCVFCYTCTCSSESIYK